MVNVVVAAAGMGWVADQIVGEPPDRWHPVAAFGTMMTAVEHHLYRPSRGAGMVHLGIGVGAAVTVGLIGQRILGRPAATVLATTVCVAGRMLAHEGAVTLALVDDDDLDGARQRVQALVGRDPEHLDGPDIVRATIESVAENTVDAVIAPMCWAAIAGAPGVLAHRAINTLDAMIGHRNDRYERFGWAAAKADDGVNYLPARVAAAAVMVAMPHRVRAIAHAVRRQAPAHPSPNGGVIEAAVAGALGIQLGGTNRYGDRVEDRGVLGDGPNPTVTDGYRAIRLTTLASGIVASGIVAAGLIGVGRRR